MICKVGVLGASGRVGLEIAGLIATGKPLQGMQFELADAVVSRSGLTSIEGVDTRHLDQPAREPVHVWIDFSRPEATIKLLEKIDTPCVIGTTGFSKTEFAKINEYSKKYPVLMASNMSPGMNWMFQLVRSFPQQATWISETLLREEHHRQKKDAPSGTAKSLLSVLESRGVTGTQVESIRAGSIVGNHSVRFVGDNEEIEIIHRVQNRKVFAEGALLAAEFVVRCKCPGLYSMEDVFLRGEKNEL